MTHRKLILLTMLLGLTMAVPASAQRRDPEVRRVLKKFQHEPSVRDVQRAAIKFYNVSPGKIESLLSKVVEFADACEPATPRVASLCVVEFGSRD